MPARRRVSVRQMELLVEFAESNPDIALGRFPGGPQAVRVSRDLWNSVAVQMNSVAEGTTKTPDQWRRYWIEFKAKTKGKAADSRRNASATGGGPNKLVPLNELEKRVLAILGPVAVEGLPGVRLPINIPSLDENVAPVDSGIAAPNPVISYPSTSTTIPQSSAPLSTSLEPLMEVEWLEEEIPSPLRLEPESQTFELPPPPSTQPALPPSTETQPALPPPTETQPALPPSTETQPALPPSTETQPHVTSRVDRHAQRSSPPARRSRSQRQFHRDERTPRWAYEIESRRIAAEERHATAMEALVELIREIRDDVHSYVNHLNS